MTQIKEARTVRSMSSVQVDNDAEGGGILHIERKWDLGRCRDQQVGERRDVRREIGVEDRSDGLRAQTALHHAVMVEDSHPVGREPDVTFKTCGTESKGQSERLEGVLRGVGLGTAVGESDHDGRG